MATVSKKGKITPVAKGTAKITVNISQNNKTFKRNLYVTVKDPCIKITSKIDVLMTGETFTLSAKAYGSKEKIKWKVSNSKVAQIDEKTGEIKGKSGGTVTVTAYAGNLKQTCKITVKEVKELTISGKTEMVVGDKFTFTVSNADKNEKLKWSVSGDNAKCLESSGKKQEVIALKAGTVKLKVKSETGYGEMKIKIKNLEFVGDNTIRAGETKKLKLNSEQAYNYVLFSMKDESIADYKYYGGGNLEIVGIKEGSTTLKAFYNGNKYIDDYTISIPVKVVSAPDFTITGDDLMVVGYNYYYEINLSENVNANWSASDTSFISLYEGGNTATVIAYDTGTFTLTASIGKKQAKLDIKVISQEEYIAMVDKMMMEQAKLEENSNTSANTGNDEYVRETENKELALDTKGSENTEYTEYNDYFADNNNYWNSDPLQTTSDSARRITKNGVIYALYDSYVYAVGLEKGTSSAKILSEVEGLPVVKICKTLGQDSSLTNVSWSGSSITLEDGCFFNNTNLTSVTLQGGDIYLGREAFMNCKSLSSIAFSGEVKTIGDMAFAGCAAITELTIPGTQTVYEVDYYGPFAGCSSLRKLYLNSKVLFADGSKGDRLFFASGTSTIEELHINIEYIPAGLIFHYLLVGNLKKLVLMNTKKIDGSLTNYETYSLEEIVFPDTLTEIPVRAFDSCRGLKKINIPASVSKIGNYAFGYCYNLERIDAEYNPNREVDVESAFFGSKFGTIQGCYLNGAVNVLSRDEYAELKTALSVLDTVKATSTSDYDIIKGCHDWIVKNTAYDYDNYLQGTVPARSYTSKGVFLYGTAVCEGYSKAFQMLMDLAGIESYIVTGYAFDRGDHAWNIVRLDWMYYHVDCTWDDPVPDTPGKVSYYYFLVSDGTMEFNRTWVKENWPFSHFDYTADDETLIEDEYMYLNEIYENEIYENEFYENEFYENEFYEEQYSSDVFYY